MLHTKVRSCALILLTVSYGCSTQPPTRPTNQIIVAIEREGGRVSYRSSEGVLSCDPIYIDVSNTSVTDQMLSHICTFGEIERLGLDSTLITDKGLETITELKSIKVLSLRGTKLSDEGLKIIGRMTSLSTLWLDNTGITDEGLKHLHGLTCLEQLGLQGTKVSANGIELIREKLPQVQIVDN